MIDIVEIIPLDELAKIDFDDPEIRKEFEQIEAENKKILAGMRVSPETMLMRFDI